MSSSSTSEESSYTLNFRFANSLEDILAVYLRPYNPNFPVVCLDESSKQQIQELIDELPVQPGKVAKFDSEYQRNGVSNLFMMFEPLTGWRHVKVTDERKAIDFAYCLKDLVDIHYPDAEKIVLVMDNLNTHTSASLYKAFPPEEAFRIAQKFEMHFTPKHGSWLDMAEIEFSALSRQCLNRRIPDQATLIREIEAWQDARNKAAVKCRWQFTTDDARTKLHKLYPAIDG
jgi:DDE superfamily endonuclease